MIYHLSTFYLFRIEFFNKKELGELEFSCFQLFQVWGPLCNAKKKFKDSDNHMSSDWESKEKTPSAQ